MEAEWWVIQVELSGDGDEAEKQREKRQVKRLFKQRYHRLRK
jgi:hypothetical protein